jgi:hypothetical protein
MISEHEMNTSIYKAKALLLIRASAVAGALFTLASVAGGGCIGGATDSNVPEGDRCNPLDSHNECSSGLVCTGQGSSPAVPFCPENYCCSVDSSGNINSTNPNCQPGCNGGAASICKANSDPGACLLSDGGSLAASQAADEDAAPTSSDDASTPDDASTTPDVSTSDVSTTPDASTPDASTTPEASTPDASTPDASPTDAGTVEGGD